ncbi:MAG TPA: hypothetical protein VJT73_17975, partial [Polyangiaceae bacterium]|nr:hypothetical protein [Polyangiaceae bacterium]
PADDDPLTLRELVGLTLESEWRYPDLVAPPKWPETNGSGIDAARKITAPRMAIDLASAGRMRIIFDSRSLPLEQNAEIRARTDRYGHVLVWPSGSQYRVLPPGAVRTLFGERRVDAIPLVRPQSSGKSDGARRAGYATKKWELTTRTGKLVLEQAKIPGAGEGGPLLCRLLAEIVAVDPSAAPCQADEVPLRAQYSWPQGGSIVFETNQVHEKSEYSSSTLLVPPLGGTFMPTGLPPHPIDTFLSKDELAAFRQKPLETTGTPAPSAPGEGLSLFNGTDVLRYAFLDSVPVAAVLPGKEVRVSGPLRGRYLVQWRTFLGDAVEPAATLELPARASLGVTTDGGRNQ